MQHRRSTILQVPQWPSWEHNRHPLVRDLCNHSYTGIRRCCKSCDHLHRHHLLGYKSFQDQQLQEKIK